MTRTFKPTEMTTYYKQQLFPVNAYGNNRLYKIQRTTFDSISFDYYYGNDEQVAKIPYYMGSPLEDGKMEITYLCGPFVFYNGFEHSKEAKVLIDSCYTLYPTAKMQKECAMILQKYSLWIEVRQDVIDRMTAMKKDATRQWTNVERVRKAHS